MQQHNGTMEQHCRIWWPDQHQLKPGRAHILFGWLFAHAGFVDVVIAAVVPQDKILSWFHTLDALQDIVHNSHDKMVGKLQESAVFTIVGHCDVHLPGESEILGGKRKHQPLVTQFVQADNFALKENSSCVGNGSSGDGDQDPSDNHKKWKCGCSVLDGFMETCRKSLIKGGNWVHLNCTLRKGFKCKLNQVPELHHLHLDGQTIDINHCHVIVYDIPTYGRHHFSLGIWDVPHKLRTSLKKPNWINDFQKKPVILDLDAVVLALNCSNAARVLIDQQISASSTFAHFICASMFSVLVKVAWHCMGVCVASVSTIVYIFFQLIQKCLSHRSRFFMLQKIFRHSWKNLHLRSRQMLYWPIFLQDTALSCSVNVEYAHKAAIQKHALWSNIFVDLLMGLFLGIALLLNIETICFWTLAIVHDMTDGVLRSGCVWLMGVPAGFKLNTELAELLGMISLNAIQIYSTLWFFVGGFLRHIFQGLALSGILLGLTVPMSFVIDIIRLATLHVSTLQWLISFIYSKQIQAVTSLWRLFRGRKWNPLRQRLDSYDYTVEQHVVGSLLFTPVLLLLPTTSIFYIFFSILSTAIICLCVMMEIAISIIHATPYAELILWLTSWRRFPSGLWFLTVSLPYVSTHEDSSLSVENCTAYGLDERKGEHLITRQLEPLVSVLRSNYASLGQVFQPNYRKILHGAAFSFCKQLAYGILSGERIPSTLHTEFSPPLPWMSMGVREYWALCCGSILSCASKR